MESSGGRERCQAAPNQSPLQQHHSIFIGQDSSEASVLPHMRWNPWLGLKPSPSLLDKPRQTLVRCRCTSVKPCACAAATDLTDTTAIVVIGQISSNASSLSLHGECTVPLFACNHRHWTNNIGHYFLATYAASGGTSASGCGSHGISSSLDKTRWTLVSCRMQVCQAARPAEVHRTTSLRSVNTRTLPLTFKGSLPNVLSAKDTQWSAQIGTSMSLPTTSRCSVSLPKGLARTGLL